MLEEEEEDEEEDLKATTKKRWTVSVPVSSYCMSLYVPLMGRSLPQEQNAAALGSLPEEADSLYKQLNVKL